MPYNSKYMLIQNFSFYRYLISSVQCNILHISVATSSHGLGALFTTGNRVITALNLSTREPIPENPEPIQKTHLSYSVPLTSPKFVLVSVQQKKQNQ